MKNVRRFLTSFLPSNSTSLQKFLYLFIFISFFLYVLSIPAFSNRYPFNYASIILCGLMCVGIIIYIVKYSRFRIDIFVCLLLLFNISTLITHLVNFNLSDIPKTMILMCIVSILLYQFQMAIEKKNIVLHCLWLAGIVFALIYIFHYKSEIFDFKNLLTKRLGGFFDNENEISKELGMFSSISLLLLLSTKNIWKIIIYIFSILLFFVLILSTGSISNLLTTLVVMFLVIIFSQRTAKSRIVAAAIGIFLVAAVVLLIQLPALKYFKTRIENIWDTLTKTGDGFDGSSSSRFDAAITAFKIGANRLIFGFGYMSATSFTSSSIQAHNNFAELLIDFGIVGLLIYEAILVIPLLFANNAKDKTKVFGLALQMFIFQLFLTTYYKKIEYVLFAYIYSAYQVESKAFRFIPEKVNDYFDIKLPEKGKRIIFEIIPSFVPVGGAEMFVFNFVNDIVKRYSNEYTVYVISLYKNNNSHLLKLLKDKNIFVIELGKKKGLDLKCAYKLRKLIKFLKPSVIHTHLRSLLTLRIACLLKTKAFKIVHTIHNNYPTSPGFNDKLEKRLIQKGFVTPVCVAKLPAETYSEKLQKKIPFINNGVDIECFDNSKPLYKRDIDFLIVGRFVDIKNHLYAFNVFRKKFRDIEYNCRVLGDGELKNQYISFIHKYKLTKKIKLEGEVSNVEKFMSNAKILLMTSINEGNPMVINEALASGMCVIGNDVGGIHDLLIGNKNCCLVNINFEDLFAKKMSDLLSEINNNKIRINRKILKDISISKTVDEYLEIFYKS